jgi:hypothetical protein
MSQSTVAKQRRREAIPAAEGVLEVRAMPVAHQARNVADRDRALIDQQLRGHRHPAREQVLVEGVPEAGVRALQLPGRGRDRPSDRGERQRAPVVARDDDPAEQIQTAVLAESIRAHTPLSDEPPRTGHLIAHEPR